MSEPRQLVLPLPQSVSLRRDDYFVSDSNRAAAAAVEAWPEWPGRTLAIIGPAGAGKTHLAAMHQARAREAGVAVHLWPDAQGEHLVVENVESVSDGAAEERLFHAFNRAAASGSILFTARTPPAGWAIRLPDLRTRLNTVIAVELPAPDDALLYAVLLKLFADRQIDPKAADETAAWLVPRMNRSLAAARALVTDLDARSLAQKRKIDPRLAAEVLGPALDI